MESHQPELQGHSLEPREWPQAASSLTPCLRPPISELHSFMGRMQMLLKKRIKTVDAIVLLTAFWVPGD